jgi:hypothetical protein
LSEALEIGGSPADESERTETFGAALCEALVERMAFDLMCSSR